MSTNSTNNTRDHGSNLVNITEWVACHNPVENVTVYSCTVTSADASASISAVGMMVNDQQGETLTSVYTALSSNSETVYPSINLPAGKVGVGDSVSVVVQGECDRQHFFFEQQLEIGEC